MKDFVEWASNHRRFANHLHADAGCTRARRTGLLSDLLRRAEGRENLPEGLRLRLAPTREALATIASAVVAERHCCRFLRFGTTVEPDGGPVFLELTGPPGTREFIGALLEV